MATYQVLDGNGDLRYFYAQGSGTAGDPYRSVSTSIEHATVDAGLVFFHSDVHTVANNAQMRYLLQTGANHTELNSLYVATTSAPVTVTMFEDSLVSANGSTETLHNLNRQSAISSTCSLYLNPTVTSDGTELMAHSIAGEKNIGGNDSIFGGRMVLKSNAKYMVRVLNSSGATANISITVSLGED